MYTDNVACKCGSKVGRLCCRIISVSSVEAGDSKRRLCFFSHTEVVEACAGIMWQLCGNRQVLSRLGQVWLSVLLPSSLLLPTPAPS
jgi:hypothetical protein